MYKHYLKYWKEILFGLIVLFWVSHVKTEQDLLFLIIFIFVMFFFILDSREAKGIHRATIDENINAVKQYLDKGIDIDKADNDGDTALILATYRNLPNMVESLIKLGANINYHIDNPQKITPLHDYISSSLGLCGS